MDPAAGGTASYYPGRRVIIISSYWPGRRINSICQALFHWLAVTNPGNACITA